MGSGQLQETSRGRRMIEVLIAPLMLGDLNLLLFPEPFPEVRQPDVFGARKHAYPPPIHYRWLDLAANHRPGA